MANIANMFTYFGGHNSAAFPSHRDGLPELFAKGLLYCLVAHQLSIGHSVLSANALTWDVTRRWCDTLATFFPLFFGSKFGRGVLHHAGFSMFFLILDFSGPFRFAGFPGRGSRHRDLPPWRHKEDVSSMHFLGRNGPCRWLATNLCTTDLKNTKTNRKVAGYLLPNLAQKKMQTDMRLTQWAKPRYELQTAAAAPAEMKGGCGSLPLLFLRNSGGFKFQPNCWPNQRGTAETRGASLIALKPACRSIMENHGKPLGISMDV